MVNSAFTSAVALLSVINILSFHALAGMVCTEFPSKSPFEPPSRMECVLSDTGDNKFKPEVLANSKKEGYRILTITTDGHLIMPSMAIKEPSVGIVRITAKEGVTLADNAFAGTQIGELSINYDEKAPFTNANARSETVKFGGLNVDTLKISGFKGFDFSNIQQIRKLHYVGSSEGQTIKWPPSNILDNLDELKLTTDTFLPHFNQLRKLAKLEIHSLSPPSEAEPVADLMDTLGMMDLSHLVVLLLDNCYTPDVINLPFSQSPRLLTIFLDSNNLNSLPSELEPGLGNNSRLGFVQLRNNNISQIPSNFFNFKAITRYLSLIGNPVRKIEHNAFTNVGDLDIWLADDADISIQAFQGVRSVEMYLTGNATISEFQDESVGRIFETVDIRCNANSISCANVCPNVTPQVCEAIKLNGEVKIENQLCHGKYDDFCS